MSSKTRFHRYVYDDETSGKFLMLPPELFEAEAFMRLSHAGRAFYLLLCTHRETEIQRGCLYKALEQYNKLLGLGLSEQDIKDLSMPNKRTKYIMHDYFVAPKSHLEKYGYKPAYASKLKKELIDAGFIKVAYGGKSRYNAWNENVTVYEFVTTWKTK